MFTEVGDLQNGPALEKAAVSSLNDPRLAVAENAASYLGQLGSAAAEKPLWDRFQAWTSDWLGLDKNSADPVAIQAIAVQLGLGDTLRNALVRGPGWLTNQEKLMHIDSLWEQLPDVNSDSSKPLLDLWNNPPLTIHCRLNDDGGGFRFRLAQYSLLGAEALQDKLSQFPSGTSFCGTDLSVRTRQTPTLSTARLRRRPASLARRSSQRRPLPQDRGTPQCKVPATAMMMVTPSKACLPTESWWSNSFASLHASSRFTACSLHIQRVHADRVGRNALLELLSKPCHRARFR